jgi:hypothetical protein
MSGTMQAEETVPRTYDELFRIYYPYAVRSVAKAGIDPANVEDVAMSILMKFIEKDVLSDYDPTVTRRNGQPIKFINFFLGFVFSYVRGYLTTQQRHRFMNPISTDQKISASSVAPELTWIDVYGEHREEDYADLMDEDFMRTVRTHLGVVSKVKKKPFLLLFDFIVLQMEENDRIHREELANLFEVSLSTMFRWLHALRTEVGVAISLRG